MMEQISQLRLGEAKRGVQYLINDVSATDLLSMDDFARYHCDAGFDLEFAKKFAPVHKNSFASRIGLGPVEWQLDGLKQLLLMAPPELPDGRRRVYTCPLCTCEHIACVIECSAGTIVWRDFACGSVVEQYAFGWENGEWKRVDFEHNALPKSFCVGGGPFFFDEKQYRSVFEDTLKKCLRPKATLSAKPKAD
jgi:hypothetical protein